jgi:hypothetical protein
VLPSMQTVYLSLLMHVKCPKKYASLFGEFFFKVCVVSLIHFPVSRLMKCWKKV